MIDSEELHITIDVKDYEMAAAINSERLGDARAIVGSPYIISITKKFYVTFEIVNNDTYHKAYRICVKCGKTKQAEMLRQFRIDQLENLLKVANNEIQNAINAVRGW